MEKKKHDPRPTAFISYDYIIMYVICILYSRRSLGRLKTEINYKEK